MSKFKYIVFTTRMGGEQMVIFGLNSSHNYVAGEKEVISAGFVNLEEEEFYGRSVSLNIDSRSIEDKKLFERIKKLGKYT